jgi:hypothetical protein
VPFFSPLLGFFLLAFLAKRLLPILGLIQGKFPVGSAFPIPPFPTFFGLRLLIFLSASPDGALIILFNFSWLKKRGPLADV